MSRILLEQGTDVLLLETGDDLLLEDRVLYPTDDITRVTSLTHRYNRDTGEYNLIIGLGEIAEAYSVPGVELVPKSTNAAMEEEEQVTKLVRGIRKEEPSEPIVKPGQLPKLDLIKELITPLPKEEPSEPVYKDPGLPRPSA